MGRPRSDGSPLLTLAAIVVAVAALHLAKEILLPLALAILISFLLTPVANRLEALRLGRVLSVITIVTVTFGVLGVLSYVVTSQLVDLGSQLPQYKDNLIAKVRQIKPESETFQKLSETLEDVQKTIEEKAPVKPGDDASPSEAGPTGDEPRKTPPSGSTEPTEAPGGRTLLRSRSLWDWSRGFRTGGADASDSEPVQVEVVGTTPSPLQQIANWLGPMLAPIGTAGIAVVLVIFILLNREDQRNRLLRLFGSAHLHATTEALTDVTDRVARYLRMQFLINANYGVAVGLGMWVLGVPNAVLWGVLSFSLRFLPYIGPWLSAVMPIVVSAAVSKDWTQPLLVAGWFTVLELLVNNVAEPLLYGRSTGVSGVGVIVAAVFWTWVWGPIGLVLAMPLTVCVVVMAKYIPGLSFLTVLLGDQPSMPDEERIYQRLLVGDVDEARQLVAAKLATAPLAEAYDRLVIPALALAEKDRHAGLLLEDQQEMVEDAARDLIDEVGQLAEGARLKDASPEVAESPQGPRLQVMCIPLRDEADNLCALLLQQLLEAERVSVRLSALESLTGELVESIEAQKIDAVVISILPPLPTRSSRLVCRRLRDRYPDLPIIVGFWSGKVKTDLEQRLCEGGVEVVHSLADAVERVSAIAARVSVSPGAA
jgi:predicted PurR-regulated permease PerM